MKSVLKNTITTGIFILLFFIGYLREAVFLTLNSVYNNNPFPYNTAYIKPPDFLYQWNESSLYYLKWSLTIGFSFVFAATALLLVHFYFKNHHFNKITIFIYLILIILSTLVSFTGLITNSFDTLYAISRFIIGLVQSPLIALVLFVLFYFKITNYDNNN